MPGTDAAAASAMRWMLPPGQARGWVWLQHGFTRRGRSLRGLAGALMAQGWAVVCPDLASLRSRRSFHDRDHLSRVAVGVLRSAADVAPGSPGVGIGHSAGAAVVTWVAGRDLSVGESRITGLVLLDPVDTVGGLIADARPRVPLAMAALRPSGCNRGGRTVADLTRRGYAATTFADLSHADPERIPAELRGDQVRPAGWAVTRLCGPGGPPADVVALGEWTLAAASASAGM